MTEKIKIIKADGREDFFSEKKFENSLKRAGASIQEINEVKEKIKKELRNGISTEEIYRKAFSFLKKKNKPVAGRYSLKTALMELGPTGYPFEQIIGRILKKQGYQVSYPEKVKGSCVSHEIDVVAEKGKEKIMVEAKFHNQYGFRTDLKTALYVKARFDDIKKSGFNRCWLPTNTKFSKDAIKYANCARIELLGWNWPKGRGIEVLIEETKLHPITAITSLSSGEKRELLNKNVVVCQDLIDNPRILIETGINKNKGDKILKEIKELIRIN